MRFVRLLSRFKSVLCKPVALFSIAVVFMLMGGVFASSQSSTPGKANFLGFSKNADSTSEAKDVLAETTGTDNTQPGSSSDPQSSGVQSGGSKKSGAALPPAQVKPSSKQLLFSPSKVSMPKNGGYVEVEVYADGLPQLYMPSLSSIGGLITYVSNEPSPTMNGGTFTLSKWTIQLKQIDPSSSGQKYLNVKTLGPGGEYTGSILVSWSPFPSFYVVNGGMDKTMDATTVTYTMHFTLVPNSPYFGNPTIYTRVYVPNQYYGGPNDYCDGGVRQKSFVYNGQNEHTLTCIMNRPLPYVPGSGPPPPLPSSFGLKLDVYGMTGGDYINGGTGLSNISWIIDSAPEQSN